MSTSPTDVTWVLGSEIPWYLQATRQVVTCHAFDDLSVMALLYDVTRIFTRRQLVMRVHGVTEWPVDWGPRLHVVLDARYLRQDQSLSQLVTGESVERFDIDELIDQLIRGFSVAGIIFSRYTATEPKSQVR